MIIGLILKINERIGTCLLAKVGRLHHGNLDITSKRRGIKYRQESLFLSRKTFIPGHPSFKNINFSIKKKY